MAPNDRSYLIEKLRYFPVCEWRYAIWFARNAMNRSNGTPIWGPRYEGIDADLAASGVAVTCALQWKRCVEAARPQIDPSDTHVIRYEDLASPSALADLRDWLAAGDSDAVIQAHERRFSLQRTWPGELPPDAVERCREIVASVKELGG